MNNKLKPLFDKIEYLFGIILPGISFAVMFVAFILQIFSRYVLNSQFPWTYDATVIGFLWTVSFGAIWAGKKREHVSFSLIYDLFGPKGRAIMNMIGNLLILVAFIVALPATLEYISFINIKKSAVLHIPISWYYAPFFAFMVFSAIYLVRDTIADIKDLRTPSEVLKEREAKAKEEEMRRIELEEQQRMKEVRSLFDESTANSQEKDGNS